MSSPIQYPDPGLCRTRHYFSTYWECLADDGDAEWDCPYLLEFKLKNYCIHDNRKEFARKG